MSTEVSASIINEELDAINISNELSQKYLLFVSDNIDFGVKASYIIEIITNHHVTPLPLLPGYIKGIINLRGQIIPILDIRSKMGKAEGEYTNYSCIIVLDIDSVMVGIYVDTVSLVADIDESKISPPSPHNKQELVNGMVSMSDGKTLFLIDCEKLIEN
nr:chemotaxis protein CheW [uncultured Anaerotignum sp.]